MKSLLFVQHMNSAEDAERIAAALSETQVDFEIKLSDRCVVIQGRNDLVYAAKVAIREAGYTVD